jgi:formylglycine-generating enzyme
MNKTRNFLAAAIVLILLGVFGCADPDADTGKGGTGGVGGKGGIEEELVVTPPHVHVGMIDMVKIPAGSFYMGISDYELGILPFTSYTAAGINLEARAVQHLVTLTKSFYIGKYEVTQEQYEAVMGSNPSKFKTEVGGESGTPGKLPVDNVKWYEALIFCNKLSIMEGLDPVYSLTFIEGIDGTDPDNWGEIPVSGQGELLKKWDRVEIDVSKNGYRLPTEAEWEYACRGDYPNKATEKDTVMWNIGNGTKMWSGMCNFDGRYPFDYETKQKTDAKGINLNRTTKVGSYEPNTYGLYDMHGNVTEWCWDYAPDGNSFTSDPQIDPMGPPLSNTAWYSGSARMVRGGAYNSQVGGTRTANRGGGGPTGGGGFRVVRTATVNVQ